MKKRVLVTQVSEIEVEIDDTKFTPEFLEEFRGYMYPFDTVEDHIKHLAQMEARGIARDFIEGYGEQESMGISLCEISADVEMEILE